MRILALLPLLVPAVVSASGAGADADLMPAPERDAIEAGMHAAESGVPPYDELTIIADSVYDYITDKLSEEFSRSASSTTSSESTTTEPDGAEPAAAEACFYLQEDVYTVCGVSTATSFIERRTERAQASTCEDLSEQLDDLFLVLDELSWDDDSLSITDELLCLRDR